MIVTSQQEVDEALAGDFTGEIWIDSPSHVRIVLTDTRGKWVGLTGNAVVKRADGNAVVEWADGNAVVEWATGNAVVERATGNAVVERATGNAVVKRADGNAVVEWADGNAVVEWADGNAVVKRADGNAVVEWADGNAVVEWADGNAVVKRADGNAVVKRADGNAVVEWADGNAVVEWADGNAVVKRADGNAVVKRATGNAVVERATGNAVVERATGNAVVKRADGNAVVEWADGNAVVKRADGNAVVKRATGTSVIHGLYEAAKVQHAGPHVTVYVYSSRATVEGGRVVDLSDLDFNDAATWAEFHGIKPDTDGTVVLYKAVNDDLKSGRGFKYPMGETVTDPKWRPSNDCGNGLHLSPHPQHARYYFKEATRFLACRVPLTAVHPINDDANGPKCKVQSCDVLYEVDLDGEPLAAAGLSSPHTGTLT